MRSNMTGFFSTNSFIRRRNPSMSSKNEGITMTGNLLPFISLCCSHRAVSTTLSPLNSCNRSLLVELSSVVCWVSNLVWSSLFWVATNYVLSCVRRDIMYNLTFWIAEALTAKRELPVKFTLVTAATLSPERIWCDRCVAVLHKSSSATGCTVASREQTSKRLVPRTSWIS